MKDTNESENIFAAVLKALKEPVEAAIPLGVSNRHIHLSEQDVESLFGFGYQLTKAKDLSQPGQYACKETLTICGPSGAIGKVRVLGPTRPKTQVEILTGDCFKLGIDAPIRLSGELEGTPGGITLAGSKGSVALGEGVIIAKRHIHMTSEDAKNLGVCDGQTVSIEVSGQRGGILHGTVVRVSDSFRLECHLDMEEANAMGAHTSSQVQIKK